MPHPDGIFLVVKRQYGGIAGSIPQVHKIDGSESIILEHPNVGGERIC